ncbi:MAG: hypothetical protein CMK07_01220 [Ponticaulis sp.]|nr:hypothetical protein [Ponticaulis sp.]
MRYMIVFHMPEGTWISKEIVRRIVSWKRRWQAEGIWQMGSPLKPPGMTQTILRIPEGQIKVEDGPLNDSSLIFYAFEILDCETMEKAVSVAQAHPGLEFEGAVIELREIWESIDPDFMGDEYDSVSPDYHLNPKRDGDEDQAD